MKQLFRFKLRTAIVLLTGVAVLCALLTNYSSNRWAQKRNVEKLVELGGQVHARQGSIDKIQVWYGGNLSWSDEGARFEISFASTFSERTGIDGWIYNNFSLDFVDSPIALEIDCHDFGTSTLNPDIINLIKKLPTVRQVWIKEWTDGNGNCGNEITNKDGSAQIEFPNSTKSTARHRPNGWSKRRCPIGIF